MIRSSTLDTPSLQISQRTAGGSGRAAAPDERTLEADALSLIAQ